MNSFIKLLLSGAVFVALLLFWAIYIRSPTVNIIIPNGYTGEIFIVFGKEREPFFLNEYNYKVDDNGLLLSKYQAPRGRIISSSLCFTYNGNQDCLPVVYGNRKILIRKKENRGIVVMAPVFTDYQRFKLSNDSIVDFSNGYVTAVIDSLSSKKEYDRDIRALFDL